MSTAAQVDLDTATVTRTIVIDAPRPLVWSVLTSPDQIAQWFGQCADFPEGVHLGAVGTFGWADHGDFPARIDTWDPVERFAFTWGTPGEEILEDNSTTATFTLVEEGGSTALTVVETGFDGLRGDLARRRAAMQDNAQGWTEELDELTAHVTALREGGSVVTDPAAGTTVRSVVVPAGRGNVWSALTTPDAIEAWWGRSADFPQGVAPGAPGTVGRAGRSPVRVRVERLAAPSCLVFRRGEVDEAEPGTTGAHVRITLLEVGTGATLLTATETGRGTDARRAAREANGWDAALQSLTRWAAGQA